MNRFKSFVYNNAEYVDNKLKIKKEDNSFKKGFKLLGQSLGMVIAMTVVLPLLTLVYVLTYDNDDDRVRKHYDKSKMREYFGGFAGGVYS